jgi:hypothetical protein
MATGNCSQYDKPTKYAKVDDGGCITASWSVREEAKGFLSLILKGLITEAEAKQDILMTPGQLAFLKQETPKDSWVFEMIYWRRQQTWEALSRMLSSARKPAMVAA